MKFPPMKLLHLGLLLLSLTPAALAAEGVAPASEALTAARAHFDARRDLEATAAFARLASDDPRAAEPAFYLGMLALRRNDPAAAVPLLEKAVELSPTTISYHLRLGDAYGLSAMKAGIFSKMSWAKKCRTQYEQAVAHGPENLEAQWSLMEYYKQAPGIAGGSFEKAHTCADAIGKFNPGAGRFAKATVFAAEKKYDEVFAPYAAALAAEPADYRALNQFARLAQMTGQRLDDGVAALQKCLAIPAVENEPSHAWLNVVLGQLHEKRGDKTAARAAYEAALVLDANLKAAKGALAKLP